MARIRNQNSGPQTASIADAERRPPARLEARSSDERGDDDRDGRAAPGSRAPPSTGRATCPTAATPSIDAVAEQAARAFGSSDRRRPTRRGDDDVREREQRGDDGGDRDRGRALAGRQRLEPGADRRRRVRASGRSRADIARRGRRRCAARPPAPPPRGRGRSRGAYGCAAPTGTSSAARSSRRRPRGRRLGDRPHDDRAARAVLDGDRQRGRVEPADREPRLADRARRVGDVVEARGGAARLGRRRVHGADREVVDVGVGVRGVGLRGRVRRAPDDPLGPDQRARRGGRAVVLADVHAVGGAGLHEVGAVVEDEQRAVRVGGGAERARGGDQPVVAERLVAQLDQVGAPAQRGVEERRAGGRRRRGRGGRSARRSRGVMRSVLQRYA